MNKIIKIEEELFKNNKQYNNNIQLKEETSNNIFRKQYTNENTNNEIKSITKQAKKKNQYKIFNNLKIIDFKNKSPKKVINKSNLSMEQNHNTRNYKSLENISEKK